MARGCACCGPSWPSKQWHLKLARTPHIRVSCRARIRTRRFDLIEIRLRLGSDLSNSLRWGQMNTGYHDRRRQWAADVPCARDQHHDQPPSACQCADGWADARPTGGPRGGRSRVWVLSAALARFRPQLGLNSAAIIELLRPPVLLVRARGFDYHEGRDEPLRHVGWDRHD